MLRFRVQPQIATQQSSKSILFLRALLGTWVLACVFASAEEDETFVLMKLEESSISADRYEQPSKEVPIAVSKFTDEHIDKYHILSTHDLAIRVPGFQFQNDSQLTMRGLGATYRGLNDDFAVGQYANQVYFENPYGMSVSTFDLERIEVLRGPQSALYGRNTMGGVINYVYKQPQLDGFDAEVFAELANFNGSRLHGLVNLPIANQTAFRLSAGSHRRDGVQQNLHGPDLGAIGDYILTPQLRYRSSVLDVNLKYERLERDAVASVQVPLRYPDVTSEFHVNPADQLPSDFRNQFFRYPTSVPPAIKDGRLINHIDLNRSGMSTFVRESLSVHSELHLSQFATLKHIFATSKQMMAYSNVDCDGSGVTAIPENPFVSSISLVSFRDCSRDTSEDLGLDTHELQLYWDSAKTSTLLGIYHFKRRLDELVSDFDFANGLARPGKQNSTDFKDLRRTTTLFTNPANQSSFLTPYVADGSYQTHSSIADRRMKSLDVYGQTTWQVGPKWQLNLGWRVARGEKEILDRRSWTLEPYLTPNGIDEIPVQHHRIGELGSMKLREFNTNLAAEYAHSLDQNLYAKLATGYRTGGSQDFSLSPSPDYDGENLLALEIGYKANLYDRRFRLHTASYAYQLEDYQQPLHSRAYDDVGMPYTRSTIDNIGEAILAGVEVETTFIVSTYFSVGGFLALQDTSMSEVSSTDPADPNQEFELITFQNRSGQTETTPLGKEVSLKGNHLPYAPSLKIGVVANGHFNLDNGGLVSYALTYSRTNAQFTRVFNLAEDEIGTCSRYDATLSWQPRHRGHKLTAFVKGISEQACVLELTSSDWKTGYYQTATLSDPMFFGISYRWSYR